MEKSLVNTSVSFEIKGTQYYGEVLSVEGKTATISVHEYDETVKLPISRLTPVKPFYIDSLTGMEIVHFERTWFQMPEFCEPLAPFLFPKPIVISLSDLRIAMRNIKEKNPEMLQVIEEWVKPIGYHLFHTPDSFVPEENAYEDEINPDGIRFLPTRADYIYSFFDEALEGLDYDVKSAAEFADAVLEKIDAILENEKTPLLKRTYTDKEKQKYLRSFGDGEGLNTASEMELELYRLFIEQLIEKDNVVALRYKGYGCYGGNAAYECNWFTARDCIIKLFALTGDAFYANTLGYIFYYGRCSNGEPEYEEAFKYFSLGAAGGEYESRYKLADMLQNGYYVPQNKKLAGSLVWDLYKENLVHMQHGDFLCKFADAAVRLGYYEEIGLISEPKLISAYYLYLQADFAIRQRLRYDYYGDVSVAKRIQESLERVRKTGSIPKHIKSHNIDLDTLLEDYLSRHSMFEMHITDQTDDKLRISIRLASLPNEQSEKMFITDLPCGFVGMLETLNITVKDYKLSVVQKPIGTIRFDRIKDDTFFLNGEEVASISGEYSFSFPTKETTKKYHMASVIFEPRGRSYDYLLELPNVKPGDQVVVMGKEKEAVVTVTNIFEKTESELPLVMKRYKKILRKA
ncbi:MAG: hypothetical protein MJ071_02750 [Oscillospiraceae bacterium]|nr:hypothetical protein [Oscillospiraceae bacterium]